MNRQILRAIAIAALLAGALVACAGSYFAGYAQGYRDFAEWRMHQDITHPPVSFHSTRR